MNYDNNAIQHYATTMTPEQISAYLEENDCIVQMAWLTGALHILAEDEDPRFRELEYLQEQMLVIYATAMADAKGKLKTYRLTLPKTQ